MPMHLSNQLHSSLLLAGVSAHLPDYGPPSPLSYFTSAHFLRNRPPERDLILVCSWWAAQASGKPYWVSWQRHFRRRGFLHWRSCQPARVSTTSTAKCRFAVRTASQTAAAC